EVVILKRTPDVGGGIQPCESLEIADKMGLIVITATIGEVDPIDPLFRLDMSEHFLEPTNAAEHLGSQADLPAKFMNEMFMAHPQFAGDSADRRHLWLAHKPLQSPTNARTTRGGGAPAG